MTRVELHVSASKLCPSCSVGAGSSVCLTPERSDPGKRRLSGYVGQTVLRTKLERQSTPPPPPFSRLGGGLCPKWAA